MTDNINTIGRRIRAVRTWRGMSLTATAELAGFSKAYLSQIEHGKRAVERRSTLEALATALRVPPSELTGQPYPPSSRAEEVGHAAAQDLRAVLRDIELDALEIVDAPRPLAELRAAVATSDAACAASDYGVLGDLVPGLLAETYVAAQATAGSEARILLAHVLHAAFYLAKDLGHGDLAWQVATRLWSVANAIAEPAWLGVADFVRAHAAVGAGARARSLSVAQQAANALPLGERHVGQVYGMLRLSAALHAAVTGQADDARSYLADARQTAARTGEGSFAGLMFGPRNVGVWEVAVALELGEPERVPELAGAVDVKAIESAGRQATFYCDVARGFAGIRGRSQDAVRALSIAEKLAPQRMRTNPYVRDVLENLLSRTRGTENRELRGLAYRAGLAV
jgi:transcriptional regulator with XRE-family HTH domain